MDEIINTGLYMVILLLAILVSVSAGAVWDHFTLKEKCGAICFVLFLLMAGILIAYIGEIPNGTNVSKAIHGVASSFK